MRARGRAGASTERTGRLSDTEYARRIERSLSEMKVTPAEIIRVRRGQMPPTDPTKEYDVVLVENRPGSRCELCGHHPISHVITIQHRVTRREKGIGSECAVNWTHADLARAMIRELQRRKQSLTNELRYRAEFEWYESFREAHGDDEEYGRVVRRLRSGRSVRRDLLLALKSAALTLGRGVGDELPGIVGRLEDECRRASARGEYPLPSGWQYALQLVRAGRGEVRDYMFAAEIAERIGAMPLGKLPPGGGAEEASGEPPAPDRQS